ncbi:MAG TPA: ScyD/ScyE family protein [Thermomicrobiaceae bacterium]|nr:ScyD/ScyE family protein [Thermomicrobiaceae bacterium]
MALVAAAPATTQVQVYAGGFINPKQLAFTPDGTLYVAESGQPGGVTVPLPANFGGKGPIGTNGRISRVPPGGGPRQDVATGLPNIGLYGGAEMLGASGLAVLDGRLYEVAAGHMTVSPKLSRVSPSGALTTIADVGAFNDRHPPPSDNGDAVPLGNPFGMVAADGKLYITDGNYDRVLEATLDGGLRVLTTFPLDPTTTGLTVGPDGNLYVCQFGQAPYPPGSGHIDRVTLDGTVTPGAVKNLTTPIGVAFAPDGTMYVLQYAAQFSPQLLRYIPFGGEVLRVNADGTTSPVVTNLVFPTAMAFGPDGALYVTNYGNDSNLGQGQVLRVVPGDQPARGPSVPPPPDAPATLPPPATPSATPAPAVPAAVRVVIGAVPEPTQWGFDPAQVTIRTGQSVTFVNLGTVAHTATDSQGRFDTGLLQPGQSVTIRFDAPGRYDYSCQPHPWMKGVLIVTGQALATPVTAGTVLSATGGGPPTIGLWRALGFVGLIVVAVFAGAYALRRRMPAADAQPPQASPPEDD